jgi:hypothetical protein
MGARLGDWRAKECVVDCRPGVSGTVGECRGEMTFRCVGEGMRSGDGDGDSACCASSR